MSSTPSTNSYTGIKGWIEYRLPIFSAIDNAVGTYPTPRNLSYAWAFGSLAGVALMVQILTGIFLAMHYTPHVDHAFDSVERIMREVNYGWLIRYIHAVGASMFFIVTYAHIARALYYGSYKSPRELVWIIGVVILLLMMATAFMGYVLPWGQMSFWGATVITNFFTAIPLVGDDITTWLLGGFSVGNATLNRFFALHFLLPFVILGVAMLHLVGLHQHGSSNPLGIPAKGPQDKIPFHPYYTVKDFVGIGVFFLVFGFFTFYEPNMLGHPDNYIEANPLVTPAHIVPEWYFLPFYAILRAVTFDIPLLLLLGGAMLLAAIAALRPPLLERNFPVPAVSFGGWAIAILLFFGGTLALIGLMGFGPVIDSKLGGVLAMFGAIAVLFVLPWLDSHPVRSGRFRPRFKLFYWLFIANAIFLGWLGGVPADGCNMGDAAVCNGALAIPNSLLALLATAYYFGYFLAILPWLSKTERALPLPESISQPVMPRTAKKEA